MLADPALEARAREHLASELRCLVCQGETIDDINAQIARDLRLLVRERLVAGDSDEEVIDFIVDRYGEFVLFEPDGDGVEPDPVAGRAGDAAGGRRHVPLSACAAAGKAPKPPAADAERRRGARLAEILKSDARFRFRLAPRRR